MQEESEKVGLQLNIQRTKIMASGPITSWQIDGETVETVSGFILGGSKITADGDCSHEIKRCLLLDARQQKRHRCIEQSFRLWKRARVGWFGRMALKHVYYHMWNKSPVQVGCRIQDAWGWCTGMTQRDGMGREGGAGFRMGNTCTPVAD